VLLPLVILVGESSHRGVVRFVSIDRRCLMSYKVHRFDINMETDSTKLEIFLNGLDGEVVSIIPNVRKTTLAQIYGATRKIDFLLVVERT
jgi:hypothetical protein